MSFVPNVGIRRPVRARDRKDALHDDYRTKMPVSHGIRSDSRPKIKMESPSEKQEDPDT